MKKKLKKLEEENEELRSHSQKFDSEQKTVEERVNELLAKVDTYKKEIAKRETQFRQLEEEEKVSQYKAVEMETMFNCKAMGLSNVTKDLGEARSQVTQMKLEMDKNKSRVEYLELEITCLTRKVNEAQSTIESLHREKSALAERQYQAENLKSHLTYLEEAMTLKDAEIDSLKTQVEICRHPLEKEKQVLSKEKDNVTKLAEALRLKIDYYKLETLQVSWTGNALPSTSTSSAPSEAPCSCETPSEQKIPCSLPSPEKEEQEAAVKDNAVRCEEEKEESLAVDRQQQQKIHQPDSEQENSITIQENERRTTVISVFKELPKKIDVGTQTVDARFLTDCAEEPKKTQKLSEIKYNRWLSLLKKPKRPPSPDTSREQIERLKHALLRKNREFDELQGQYKIVMIDYEDLLKRKNAPFKQTAVGITTDLAVSAPSDLQDYFIKLQNEVMDLKERLARKNESLTMLERDRDELDNCRAKLSDLESENRRLTRKYRNNLDEYDNLKKDYRELREGSKHAKSNAMLKTELSKVRRNFNTQQESLEVAKRELENSRKQCATLQQQCDIFRKKYKGVT